MSDVQWLTVGVIRTRRGGEVTIDRGARVNVRIVYCVVCGYRGRAERLAHAIRDRLGVAPVLERGRLSQFDVFVDDELVTSREGGLLNHLTWGGFPNEESVGREAEDVGRDAVVNRGVESAPPGDRAPSVRSV
jgi:selT/selW/selH-like putative selenoprotein